MHPMLSVRQVIAAEIMLAITAGAASAVQSA